MEKQILGERLWEILILIFTGRLSSKGLNLLSLPLALQDRTYIPYPPQTF